MLQRNLFTAAATFVVALTCTAGTASAQTCATLPSYAKLKAALVQATKDETSGLNNQMWGTIVDRDGVVCAVAFSGKDRFAQWPGSRVISAQKANTANAFGLDSGSFSAVQPGGSLYGLQFSNPVNEDAGYKIPSAAYGTAMDPMKGSKIGGVNVFGGGLALFAAGKKMVGGIGVSGDTSCADHFIAWRVRNNLGLDHMAGVGGISGDPQRPDNIVFDIGANGQSAGGFGHPKCINTGNEKTLPPVQP
jgi:uncharacterized protein GlcG (DUF336 family)